MLTLLAPLLLFAAACRSQSHATVSASEDVRYSALAERSSARSNDSIIFRDSIILRSVNDTVYNTRIIYRERYHTLRDTIDVCLVDTVHHVEYVSISPPAPRASVSSAPFKIAVALALAILIAAVYIIRRRPGN